MTGTWAIATPAFTTYVEGDLELSWRPNAAGELVPYVISALGLELELRPGSWVLPATSLEEPAE
jgi:hypothetical protein